VLRQLFEAVYFLPAGHPWIEKWELQGDAPEVRGGAYLIPAVAPGIVLSEGLPVAGQPDWTEGGETQRLPLDLAASRDAADPVSSYPDGLATESRVSGSQPASGSSKNPRALEVSSVSGQRSAGAGHTRERSCNCDHSRAAQGLFLEPRFGGARCGAIR
jgi:hypothetical protein